MDEKTIIYALASIIATVMGFVVRRELSREKDKEMEVQARLKDKETEIARAHAEADKLREELKAIREWKDKLYEDAIQRRIQNGTADRR